MSDRATNFIKQNWFQFSSVIVLVVFSYANLQEVSRRVDLLERAGPPVIRERIQATEAKIDYVEKRLTTIEADAKHTSEVISDFRSDLRVVVEWVKEQKRKEK